MGSIESLLSAMDELAIARNVGIPHDEARMNYSLGKNTVASYEDFTHVIADYYNYHVSRCVVHGGYLSHTDAAGSKHWRRIIAGGGETTLRPKTTLRTGRTGA